VLLACSKLFGFGVDGGRNDLAMMLRMVLDGGSRQEQLHLQLRPDVVKVGLMLAAIATAADLHKIIE
jgi:hypothetical protein